MSRLPVEEAQRLARGNHRVTVRYHCAPATTGKLYIADDHVYIRAWLENASKSGVGLTVANPLPMGAFVVLQMRSPSKALPRELSAQVIHSTMRTPTEWLIGCEWLEPLSDDELDAFL